AVEASNHIDAHNLHELVFELHGVDRPVMDIGDRRNAAGTLVHDVGIDGLHGLIGRRAMTAQIDELPGLLRRVANDADTDGCVAAYRGWHRPLSTRSAAHEYRGRRRP